MYADQTKKQKQIKQKVIGEEESNNLIMNLS